MDHETHEQAPENTQKIEVTRPPAPVVPVEIIFYFSKDEDDKLTITGIDKVQYTDAHYIVDQGNRKHVIPHTYQQLTMVF